MKGDSVIRSGLLVPWLAWSAVALAPLVASAWQSSGLSADERTIAGHVDAHQADALALLEHVVNINSGTTNLPGVAAVGAVFRAELDRLGFKTQWIDQSAVGRAGHLVADHPGTGPRLLLIGHLDTVFEKTSAFQTFRRIDERSATGPGIIDMKGGDVVMVQALKALDAAGLLKTMNIVVVMNGDEEEPGRPRSQARAPLVAAAKGADVAIGFEDGDGDPSHAIVARRGTTSWDLQVTAKSGHSSQVFSEDIGSGAIFEAARILSAFHDRLSREPHLTFNPGVIVGGTVAEANVEQASGMASGRTNVVAAQARVLGDLRALSVEQFDHARQVMREIVSTPMPHASATIAFDEGYPPLAPSEGNTRLLEWYSQASRDLGFGPVTPVSPDKAGAADVSFVAGSVKMILDAVGLKGHDDHSPNETADLTTLPMQTKRAAILLSRIARQGVIR
jgi:glutamate carboxypeptidase